VAAVCGSKRALEKKGMDRVEKRGLCIKQKLVLEKVNTWVG